MNIFLRLFCYSVSVNPYSTQESLRDTEQKLRTSYEVIQNTVCDSIPQHSIPIFQSLSLPAQVIRLICQYIPPSKSVPCTKHYIQDCTCPNYIINVIPGYSGGFVSAAYNNFDEPDIKIWNSEGMLRHTLSSNSSCITGMAIFPDSNVLVVSSSDHIKLWDPQSGECLQTILGRQSICKLPNDQLVTYRIEKGEQTKITLWDIQQKKAVMLSENTFTESIWNIQPLIVATNNIAFVGNNCSDIFIWHHTSDKILRTFYPYVTRGCHISCIMPLSRRYLATIGSNLQENYKIRLWNIFRITNKMIGTLINPRHTKIISILPLRNDKLVTGCNDGAIDFWDITKEELEATLTIPDKQNVVIFAELSHGQLAAGFENGRINIYTQGPTGYHLTSSLKHHAHPVVAIKELSNGKVVSADTAGTMIIWDSR